MGIFNHVYPFGKSVLKSTASSSPLLDGDKPSSSDDVHEEYVVPGPRRRVSTMKTLVGLLVLGGIVLTALAALPRWTSDETPSKTPLTTKIFDNELYLPEGYMEQVLAHHGIGGSGQKGAAAATLSTNSSRRHDDGLKTHKLNKRAAPNDQLCGPENVQDWLGRVCDANNGIRAWIDICDWPGHPQDLHYQGQCPEGTHCAPYIDGDGDANIVCRNNNPPQEDNLDRGEKRQKLSQYGYRVVPQPSVEIGHINAQILETVKLLADIPSASTSALFVDDKKSYAIAPHNEMNANEVGYTIKLCRSGKLSDSDGRECKPTTTWSFNANDAVSFNFGIANEQSGVFFYSIVGS